MYNHAPENYSCPFCLFIQGIEHPVVRSVHSDIVYQDPRVTALISLHQWPNNPGNVLIIPNEHFENIYDLPVDFAVDIQRAARAVALAMKAAFACAGVSTRQHNEPAGSQDVWHYHLHVTPRHTGDHFYATRAALMVAGDRAALANKLKDHLGQPRGIRF